MGHSTLMTKRQAQILINAHECVNAALPPKGIMLYISQPDGALTTIVKTDLKGTYGDTLYDVVTTPARTVEET